MSKYAPLVHFETEFENDVVTMDLDQLSRKTLLSWTPYMSEIDEDGKLNEEMTIKLVGEAAEILPEYVQNFSGLKDMDGNAIQIETVIEKIYFIELVSEMVMELIEISQIGKKVEVDEKAEDAEGKSDGPRLASSKA